METRLNKVKAFEQIPFSADRVVLRSYQPAATLSLSGGGGRQRGLKSTIHAALSVKSLSTCSHTQNPNPLTQNSKMRRENLKILFLNSIHSNVAIELLLLCTSYLISHK